MIAKVIQIGNSKGIRIPKIMIEEIGAPESVELIIEDQKLVIKPIHNPRKNWGEAFKKMAKEKDDHLLDENSEWIENEWDQTEWEW